MIGPRTPADPRRQKTETGQSATHGRAPDDRTEILIELGGAARGESDRLTVAADEDEVLAPGSGMLVVKQGPNAGARFRLEASVVSVGRHPESDIYLDDITVSRRHAEVRSENGQFRIVDRGSLNNTYLNREPIDSAVLATGDEIQIGNFRLVFIAG
ncbi:MAG: FHA domain-containing protein [Mycobacterium sp.]|nr:FHA domain-containing protein [Mycobacterium sp.]